MNERSRSRRSGLRRFAPRGRIRQDFRDIGFDLATSQGRELSPFHRSDRRGLDRRSQGGAPSFRRPTQRALSEADFIVVAVPTPVDEAHQPDFTPLVGASETGRAQHEAGRRRRLRVDGLPRRHRGRLRPGPREVSGMKRKRRLPPRLLARAHQPGRQGAHAREDHEGRLGRGRRDARARRATSTARSSTPASTARRRSRSPRPRRSSRTRSAISTSRS